MAERFLAAAGLCGARRGWAPKTIELGFSATGAISLADFGQKNALSFGLGPDLTLANDLDAVKDQACLPGLRIPSLEATTWSNRSRRRAGRVYLDAGANGPDRSESGG